MSLIRKSPSGLESLFKVGITLDIRTNHELIQLFDLTGLKSIGDSLRIISNRNLAECSITFICDFLKINARRAIIDNNASQCASAFKVVEGCNLSVVLSVKDENPLMIFPNPANSSITIDGLHNVTSIRILNLYGQVVFEETVNEETLQINLNGFISGLHYIELLSNEERKLIKFIKI